MGACDFYIVGKGKTMDAAFDYQRQQAGWESGRGYSGTIAEKGCVTLAQREAVPYAEATVLAEKLLDDERYSDKWGPAGAIPLTGGGWLFFGLASY